MAMRLVFHGGLCCGIKHIYNLGENPESYEDALTAAKERNEDLYGNHVSSDLDFFTDSAPAEKSYKRLDRFLAFCKKRRPEGIVEITLVTPQYHWSQEKWVPIITERGFVEVTPAGGVRNSNSGNKVRVFHLYTTEKD